ncbi:MAG: hypothetical protein RRA15_04815 [bacterium]|nr:hypothetical protein [bacterium]MDT8365797.1 hypothetical protein [bacterium]
MELELILDPAVRRNWIEEKGMLAFSLYDRANSWFQVDILINEPVSFSANYDNREKMDIEGSVVPLAPIEALIAMKEGTGWPQDEADTVHLRRILAGWDDE